MASLKNKPFMLQPKLFEHNEKSKLWEHEGPSKKGEFFQLDDDVSK
jgi:hypothetical protein